ncbi:MAG: hypothetical protein J0G95_05295 [Rhizobiales bacterium]|nr:hypothetical protein [Hyphomicrobiales bacterium]
MIGSRLLTQAGIGASVAVHLVILAWIVFGTGVRPFDPHHDTIAIDLVTPDELKAAQDKQTSPPEPETPERELADQSATPAPPPAPEPPAPDPAPVPDSTPPSASQEVAVNPPASTPPQPTPAPSPSSSALLTLNAPPVVQPDITGKYGTMFNLSDTGFDPVTSGAKIEKTAIESFLAHLKTCSVLPSGISLDDKVRIVLRVALQPNGVLAAAPALIEASASAKGPLLMQAAIKAIETCQPYGMLPPDKYDEWRVLDLAFTPRNFGGG